MRLNDLTPEEIGIARLLQSLDRDLVAPDPEFLRRLRETTTAAFMAAQPAHYRARPARSAVRPDPLPGRQRLRSIRWTIFSSVAALLLIGLVSPVLYPARGVELGVAMLNLARASSAEILVHNAAGANTMSFARGDDTTLHWRVDYASGNAEVSNGGAAYFVNRDNNSVHPSPTEPGDVPQLIVEEKLLASLNVNDPAVQSSLLKQRPQSELAQNGQRLYVYNFQAPAVSQPGERLTVNATVDAATNTLVAMDSEVIDAEGRLRFKANADVTALNLAVPISRFAIDPQAHPSEQIAMVEDVQGQAVVADVERLLAAESSDAVALHTGPAGEAVALSAAPAMASPALAATAPVEVPSDAETKPDAKPQAGAFRAADKDLAPPALAAKGMARDSAVARPGAAPSASRTIDGQSAAGTAIAGNLEKPGLKKGSAVTRDLAEEKLESLNSPAPANRSAKLMARDDQRRNAPPGERTAKSIEIAQAPAAAPPPSPSNAKDEAKVRSAGQPADPARQLKSAGPSTRSEKQSAKFSPDLDSNPGFAAQPNTSNDRAQQKRKTNAAVAQSEIASEPAATAPLSIQFSQAQVADTPELLNRLNNGLAGNLSRNGEYGLIRRQVAAQTELRPGGILTTDVEASSIVWVRLANDADVVVGPGSEVRMLKPTEVQLQSGELLLDVPPGDQVDLLGPETWNIADNRNTRGLNRNYQQPSKSAVSRQQVAGRAVFRVERNQLQRVAEDPAWLVDYFAKQSNSSQNGRSLSRQSGGVRGGQKPPVIREK